MEEKFVVPPLVDQTDKEAEMFRGMVVAQGDHIEILKNNVKELQGQLQLAYRRIGELNEALHVEVEEKNKNAEHDTFDVSRIAGHL